MPIKTGKEKLADFFSTELSIDWDDLLHYGGAMQENLATDIMLSKLLRFVGIGIMVLALVVIVLSGKVGAANLLTPRSWVELFPWIGAFLVLYSMFLNRNRYQFSFTKELNSLTQLRRKLKQEDIKIVELESYFETGIWSIIDKLYFSEYQTFWLKFMEAMFTIPAATELVERLGIEPSELKSRIITAMLPINASFESQYRIVLPMVFDKAMKMEFDRIDARIFVLVFAETFWKQPLLDLGITHDELEASQMWLRNQRRTENYKEIWEKQAVFKPKGVVNRAYTNRYAPTLEKYAEDYTKAAASGGFYLSMGRDQTMSEIIKVLQKQNGASAVLVGEPGVGKTRFLRHLAVRMVVEDVPKVLKDTRLVAFNFNKAFSQNQSFEAFKEILLNIFEEVAASGNIILILDDMDQLLNIRSDLQAEVVNIIVNSVNKYNLRVVGTSTVDGYNRFIKTVSTLASLFPPVNLPEPTPLVALQILIDEIPNFEAKYGIKIQVKAVKQIVTLCPKFAYERVMPDKALDLLEEALLDARDQGSKYLTMDIVNSLISRKIGVNVGNISQSESETLLKLEDNMHKRVVGQDAAITAIASAMRRSRAGLSSGHRPIASFLFFGPTGVGKTEVAKTLAGTYYGDEKMMIRVDMSEYQEEQNLGRLIGEMDGNKFTGGFLTEAVRSRPFSLVLLDEIEKANPKVLDLFLQVLDEGNVTDGGGRKVDFTNTIVIATSNAGSREIAELISKGEKYDQVYAEVLPVLRQIFRVEFLNRFDKVIMFKPLLPIEVEQIAAHMMDELNLRLIEKGMGITYTKDVLKQLVEIGYDPVFGAREIRRIIQEKVEDKVAEAIVRGQLTSGGILNLTDI